MVVSLAQILFRSLVMDVVVEDIPARFGMLLSRSWGDKLGGVLKLDFTYAIIKKFGGKERRLYRETRFVKTLQKMEQVIHLYIVKRKIIFLASCCMIMQNWLKITRGGLLQPI